MPGQYVINKLFKIQIYGFQAQAEKANFDIKLEISDCPLSE